MADIFHSFPIQATPAAVYEGVSQPAGLDHWWTLNSSGVAEPGATYELGFGPGYRWKGQVTQAVPAEAFELEMTEADPDWLATRIGFRLEALESGTQVHFWHTGWPDENQHYRTSSYCWAMYLRVLKRFLEFGEEVAYSQRLEV